MQIFLARNNVQAGPYTLDEVNRMLASGEVILSDLAWHAPMDAWQPLGNLTGGELFYNPPIYNSPNQTPTAQTTNQASGEQNELKSETRRVTVAELYGQKPTQNQQDNNQSPQNSYDNRPKWGQPKSAQTPQNNQGEWQGRHSTPDFQTADVGELVLASVGSRFLATMINGLLFFGAMFPFLQAFVALNPDPDKMNKGDFATRMAYAQELAQKIEPSQVTLTMLFMLGLLIVQSVLIVKNGQSLGKLVAGIKIVDAKTRQKPSAGVVFGVRGVLLFVIYWLSSAFGANAILVVANYLMASFSKDKQGWHDKMAGTLVVKTKKIEKK